MVCVWDVCAGNLFSGMIMHSRLRFINFDCAAKFIADIIIKFQLFDALKCKASRYRITNQQRLPTLGAVIDFGFCFVFFCRFADRIFNRLVELCTHLK